MYTTDTAMVPGENQTKKIGGKVEQKQNIKKITAKYKSKKYKFKLSFGECDILIQFMPLASFYTP